ncbi:hypothetical protein [Demequina sp. NBRC 110055]|uniref:AAA family ATPase n=1 Tax=Demequina sp. NBRC 110055 TaxID=1570344 RepID=UPI000A05286A|nr:hypothetical protein [Demequina sp. NBRC 110055]
MTRISVIVAVAGPRESGIVEACTARRDLEVVRRCADLVEAVAAARAGVGAVMLVSDHARLTREVIADVRAQGVAVVAWPRTRETGEQLARLGIAAVLAPHATDEAIAQAVADAVGGDSAGSRGPVPTATEHDAVGHRGMVVAVWGPTGAPGRTTVALNLAAEAAHAGREALLIDADTYGGAVAQACGLLDEAPGLAGLARIAQRGTVRGADVDAAAIRVSERWRVITGISRPHRWLEVPGVALDEVWQGAREAAEFVVIDAGFGLERDEELTYDTRAPQRHGATLSALNAADAVVAVGTAEPLGIQRLIHGLADLADVGVREPVVVVNRVRADVAGSRPEEAVADALVRYAGIESVWTLPWDPRAADAATLAGRALAERAPRSALRRSIAALAAALTPATLVEAARPSTLDRHALSH